MEEIFFIIIIFYLGLCVGVGMLHESRGYNLWTGFFLALLLSPLIGFIISISSGRKITRQSIALSSNLKLCPFCKEPIQIDAIICKHCHKPQKIKKENPQQTTDIFCSNCNTKLSGKSKFCPECGNAITDIDRKLDFNNTQKQKKEIPHKGLLVTILVIIAFIFIDLIFDLNLIPEPIIEIFSN
jgi:hypothetical protein